MAPTKHVICWNGTSVETGKARLDIAQNINSKANPFTWFLLRGLRRDLQSISISPAVTSLESLLLFLLALGPISQVPPSSDQPFEHRVNQQSQALHSSRQTLEGACHCAIESQTCPLSEATSLRTPRACATMATRCSHPSTLRRRPVRHRAPPSVAPQPSITPRMDTKMKISTRLTVPADQRA